MSARLWSRYVAIGDSFTEGLCDEDPRDPSRYAGWADRLAAHLAERAREAGGEFGYANLAVRGRLLGDIVGPQLEAAVRLQPDLVSIVGGGNDILRPRADVDVLAGRLEAAVVRIRETGADVLMATPANPREAPLVNRTWGRHAAYTADIWSIARRHGAHVIDQWGMRALRDWRLWADDRIHLTSEGHRRIALAALEALGLDSGESAWREPLPPAPRVSRRDAAVANARWARVHVAPWVRRRLRGESSGDRLGAKRPDMAPLT